VPEVSVELMTEESKEGTLMMYGRCKIGAGMLTSDVVNSGPVNVGVYFHRCCRCMESSCSASTVKNSNLLKTRMLDIS